MQLKVFVYIVQELCFLCSFLLLLLSRVERQRRRQNFRVLFGCLALFMCLVLVALNKCRKYMYKRNEYEYYMLVCRTYLSPHSPQAKTNKLNKSRKVVGEKSICY